MKKSTNYDFWLPETIPGDAADIDQISNNFSKLDTITRTPIASQTNSIANTYQVKMPFKQLNNDVRFLFIPLYANTGASTIEVIGANENSFGNKKIVDGEGVQISAANTIQSNKVHLLKYDASAEGGEGAFGLFLLSDPNVLLKDGSVAMTGALTLSGDPVQPMEAVPKQYVDNNSDHDFYNLSFEYDSNNDGIPDKWTFTAYPGGSGTIDTDNPMHGSKCFKITHPGGDLGNGGGKLVSSYIPISPLDIYLSINVMMLATVTGMKNEVKINFYDKTKSFISTTSLYSSTSNSTNPILFMGVIEKVNFPSNARYYTIELSGGDPSVSTGGVVYFDGISIDSYSQLAAKSVSNSFSIAASGNITNTTYTDIGSFTMNLERIFSSNILSDISVIVQLYNGAGQMSTHGRLRIGTTYTNEANNGAGQDGSWKTFTLTFNGLNVSLQTYTIYMQIYYSSAGSTSYSRGQITTTKATLTFDSIS